MNNAILFRRGISCAMPRKYGLNRDNKNVRDYFLKFCFYSPFREIRWQNNFFLYKENILLP